VGAVLYATTSILPLILQTLLGYTALQSGLTISPRGLGAIVGGIIGGQLISRVDSRYLVGVGFAVLAFACYQLSLLNTQIAQSSMLIPIVVSGLAVSSIFVPMTTLSVSSISKEQMGDATGLTALVRNLGGSIGISVVTALVARSSQLHQAMMVSHLTPADIGYGEQMAKLTSLFAANVSQGEAQARASAIIYQELQQQAAIMAYLDQFRLFACICLGCILIVPLFRRARAGTKVEGTVH
jgi:MFS transporter, DHA2 family, multidrug resistance protein